LKPAAFDYHAPRTVEDALAALAIAGPRCVVLAGGQSLLPLLSLRRLRPGAVVDINRVAELTGVTVNRDTVRIGAMTRLCAIERDPALRAALPILPETAALVAYPQIRTRTTLGGSLCHADPAAELPTLAVALGARLHLRSAAGHRTEHAADFFRAPTTTSRRAEELLTEVELARRPGFRFRFEEATLTGGFPTVGLCLGVATDGDGTVTEARAAAGGVADRPVRLHAAERLLVGRDPAADVADVLEAVSVELAPPTDPQPTVRYRIALLGALLRRALARLATKEGG
jgi:carbon-monoxide dehydrogenase medium subunit